MNQNCQHLTQTPKPHNHNTLNHQSEQDEITEGEQTLREYLRGISREKKLWLMEAVEAHNKAKTNQGRLELLSHRSNGIEQRINVRSGHNNHLTTSTRELIFFGRSRSGKLGG
jgi:hypothetical protein